MATWCDAAASPFRGRSASATTATTGDGGRGARAGSLGASRRADGLGARGS